MFRHAYEIIKQFSAEITFWIGIVASIVLAVGFISSLFAWGSSGPFQIFRDYHLYIWLGAISAFIIAILISIRRLNNRFTSRFSEDFRSALNVNWDYVGGWRIAEPGTLIVTESDAGGITKAGATWENYTFSFKARIVNQCLGVIIRAQDLNNYYMLQINRDKIRPHRRVAVPAIVNRETVDGNDNAQSLREVKYLVGWQTEEHNTEFKPVPIYPKLEEQFEVIVEVRGESIKLKINNTLVYQRDSFLKIATGKVGFRNYGNEEAHVQDVRVRAHP